MNESDWRELLEAFETVGELHPVEMKVLDDYESCSGFKLPASYRHFCKVFGPGNVGDWFEIAVPEFKGKTPTKYDIESLTSKYRESLNRCESLDDPHQLKRAVIFGSDCTGAIYFWDPAEHTDEERNECAIYAVWRDFNREQVSDTFWEFANICLHRGTRTLYDEPPRIGFRAAWFGGRVKRKGKA